MAMWLRKHVEIPNSVTSLGEKAFYCCSALESIKLSNSVVHIGANAFDGCSTLKQEDVLQLRVSNGVKALRLSLK